jgi:hypothetical protein
MVVNNGDREIESAEIGPAYTLHTKSDTYLEFGPKLFYENVSDIFSFSENVDVPRGRYTFYGLSGLLRTPRANLLWSNTSIEAGSFYDGRRYSIGTTPSWSVSKSLELSGTVRFNWISFPDRGQEYNTRLASRRTLLLKYTYTFNMS